MTCGAEGVKGGPKGPGAEAGPPAGGPGEHPPLDARSGAGRKAPTLPAGVWIGCGPKAGRLAASLTTEGDSLPAQGAGRGGGG